MRLFGRLKTIWGDLYWAIRQPPARPSSKNWEPNTLKTGSPIVYTSADSVFQVAAHEDVISVEELYDLCRFVRDMLKGKHGVGRVIARPFVGTPGAFQRTQRRKDWPLIPERATVLDQLLEAGYDVTAVGKIDDLFGRRGMNRSFHSANNRQATKDLLRCLEEPLTGLLFVNLVEFDMIYGHRNDPEGYAQAITEFDHTIPEIQNRLRATDICMIVADHGVDPTTPSTDHSREYIPLLVFGPPVRPGINLGTRSSFADVGATVADLFGLPKPEIGISFADEILDK